MSSEEYLSATLCGKWPQKRLVLTWILRCSGSGEVQLRQLVVKVGPFLPECMDHMLEISDRCVRIRLLEELGDLIPGQCFDFCLVGSEDLTWSVMHFGLDGHCGHTCSPIFGSSSRIHLDESRIRDSSPGPSFCKYRTVGG
jgi:hypothetical protein